jgi:hypothetical protein
MPTRLACLQLAGLLPLAALGLALGGCGAVKAPGAAGHGGDSGSVVASITGIDPADEARQNVGYWLQCDNTVRVQGKPSAGSVTFPGAQIQDNVPCSMEVRIDPKEVDALGWKWFGRKAGAVEKGLMYGTNKAAPKTEGASRKLSLTLYKLYAQPTDSPFGVRVFVSFDAAAPAEGSVAASLTCDKSYGGDYVRNSDKEGTLVFNGLDTAALKGKKCLSATLLAAGAVKYQATTDIELTSPEKGKSYDFPVAGAPKPRYPMTVPATDVTTVITEGKCVNFDAASGACVDVSSVKLAAPKSYLVARVQGRLGGGNGDVRTVYVGAGAGFDLFDGGEIAVAKLNDALHGKDGAAKLSFFAESIAPKLDATVKNADGALALDADFIAAKDFASDRLDAATAKDLLLLSLEKVWVHGVRPIDKDALDAMASARWIADVKYDRASGGTGELLVGGDTRYFASSARAATVDGKPRFFDAATVIADAFDGDGPTHWSLFAVKGAAAAPSGCDVDLAYVTDTVGVRADPALADGDARLESCKLSTASLDADLKTAKSPTATFYVFKWSLAAP